MMRHASGRSPGVRIRQLTERLGPPAPSVRQVTYTMAHERPDGTLVDEAGELIAEGAAVGGMHGRVTHIIVVASATQSGGSPWETAS